jgi:small subunit ribosomal protein S25e
MPPKVQKSKAAKLLAAQSASKGKGKKKKWSKGKLREKKAHRVVFTKGLLDSFVKEVPKKQKLVTIYNLVENYKINCSLARKGIRELLKRNLISPVAPSGTYGIWTKSASVIAAEAAAKAEKAAKPAEEKKTKAEKGAAKKGKADKGAAGAEAE